MPTETDVVLVLEGVSATRSELGDPWDVTVWVDAPRDTRLQVVRHETIVPLLVHEVWGVTVVISTGLR